MKLANWAKRDLATIRESFAELQSEPLYTALLITSGAVIAAALIFGW